MDSLRYELLSWVANLKIAWGYHTGMKFGYFLRPGITYEGMVDLAQHAEELGLHGAYLNDHVLGLFREEKMPFLEAMTTLAAVGVQTKKIRLGHITIFNGLRNPAYLAKTISTLDNLFKGRYDTILGAGWMKKEYEGYDLTGNGKGVPPGWKRADLLIETIKIIKGMTQSPEFSYKSKYWKLDEAYNYPLSLQQPMPVIVGGSKPRTVRAAVKYADGVNALCVGRGLGALRDVKYLLDSALDKYDKSQDEFGFSGFDHMVWHYGSTEEYEKGARDTAERFRRPVETVNQDLFMGTTEVLIEKFRKAEDMGVDTMIIFVRPTGDVKLAKENLSRFRDEVISQL
jgi:alkanesulfonate monooxygenase SsuD/methylene tetrahydromethanopterin reductase-like flavin-dependent oxidoreductase (luciferase family)